MNRLGGGSMRIYDRVCAIMFVYVLCKYNISEDTLFIDSGFTLRDIGYIHS